MANIELDKIPIESLPSTSIVTIRRFKSLGINTYWDLLNYFPNRFEDYSMISRIGKLQEGEIVTITGEVKQAKNQYVRKRFTIQNVTVADESGEIGLVWYNQPYLIKLFQEKKFLSVAGEVKHNSKQLYLQPKEYEFHTEKDPQIRIHTGKLVPIYPTKRGLSSRTIREKIFYIVRDYLVNNFSPILEILPPEIIIFHDLIPEEKAYKNIHFPKDERFMKAARQRLSFDEFFIIQLSAQLIKKRWKEEKIGFLFKVKEFMPPIVQFIKQLPFTLTGDQKKVLDDIFYDLSKKHPMNRFLQGDVGSGKTVVAAVACYLAYQNGYQTLFMAPTEILAFQHYQTLRNLFKNSKVRVGLQTKSKKITKTSGYDIIVGTHALLNEKVKFNKIGLVVIDEQHRFGVRQRALLKAKGINPHLLTMTATPIPRTVALTLYGELDISTISEMPKGRVPIKTFLVPKKKRNDGYEWIKKLVGEEKTQVFIICPLIEESDHETMQSIKAATKEYEYLSKNVFGNLKLGLLHGKMKSKEKDLIMKQFKDKKVDILVATPVVEVGIDIPNATVMMIEAAERYGLAQLHQLRGRVGRANKQSYCLLFTEKEELQINNRLSFFAKNSNGADIAQYDLQKRGPGELYGTRQHGFSALQIATLSDYALIEKTNKAAQSFLKKYKDLDAFGPLKKRVEKYQLDQIARD